MRDFSDRPDRRPPVPVPAPTPAPAAPVPGASGPRNVNAGRPGSDISGSGPRPIRPGRRPQPPRTPGGAPTPPPAQAPPPAAPGGRALPPRLQRLVDSGQLTPEQAAARYGAFKAGTLPGQQPQPGGLPTPAVAGSKGILPPGKGPMTPPGPPGGGMPGVSGQGLPGEIPQPNAFNDPFSSFLSAVPIIEMNRRRGIDQSMVDAGFSGNRYSDAAMRNAGQIGAEAAQQENALLLQTLYDYSQGQENRALQATGMATGLGGLMNQIQQSQLQLPAGLGMWEQGRQDQFANLGYEDFERNKLGWFPHFLQAAMSQGAGSPGQIYTTQTPGSPGGLDWLQALGAFF